MGTGINSQFLYTSPSWKFETISGLILLVITIPLTYTLTKEYNIIGTAMAGLASLTAYNLIRCSFIYYKYKMQPFTIKSLFAVLLAIASYTGIYFLTRNIHGLPAAILKSILYSALFIAGVLYLELSPDLKPVIEGIRHRIKKSRQ